MTSRDNHQVGAAHGAELRKDGDPNWTLVLVRELRHSREQVWAALTDPAQLREWAPFDADRSLAATGSVTLTTVGAPQPHVTQNQVTRADAPSALEFTWGGNLVRWQLEPHGTGTRLTLWATIHKSWIAMGAAGWHLCLDVLDRHLGGAPLGRIAGPAAMQVKGWPELLAGYATLLGVDPPKW